MKKKIDILQQLEQLEKKEHIAESFEALQEESIISLKLKDIDSLFNPLDPDSIEIRDLSQDVSDYIFEKSKKIPLTNRITLNIYIDNIQDNQIELIKQSISNHFMEKAQEQLIFNKRDRKKWANNSIKGLICLGLCLLGAHIFSMPQFEDLSFSNVLSESLGILGWVAIWEPAEFYLYGRKDNSRELKKFMKLHRAKINIISK